MKFRGVLILLMFFQFFIAPAAASVDVSGAAGILMDFDTGEVLWGYNEQEQRAPASITKLVTALLALEYGNLDDEVLISDTAVDTRGSIVWLRAGETQTLENLIYACMLNSGNDAARAVAEHIGGSIEEFVEMMNLKAKEIGAVNTQFNNPNGLPDEGHYSTAYDIALITREAVANADLVEILGTKNREWKGMDWDSQLANLNDMLWRYEGTLGGKTGSTTEAGNCLANVAERGDLKLIGVVLGSTSRDRLWSDMTKILDYGFENFHKISLVNKGEEILQIEIANKFLGVMAGENFKYLVSKDTDNLPEWRIKIDDFKLPVKENNKIGELSFNKGDFEIGRVELVAAENFKKPIKLIDIYVVFTMIIFGLLILIGLIKFFKTLSKRRKFRSRRVSSRNYTDDF